jgi:hypothetical protein
MNKPSCFDDTDDKRCIFARDYRPGAHKHGEYQPVFNFKIPPSACKSDHRKQSYKTEATEKFASELTNLFTDKNCYVAIVPSSKTPDHPEYDDRFERLLDMLDKSTAVNYIQPIISKFSRGALHFRGGRSVDTIYSNLQWCNVMIPDEISTIFLIDDVLTTGATFKACQRLIYENSKITSVLGVFWAKTVPMDSMPLPNTFV